MSLFAPRRRWFLAVSAASPLLLPLACRSGDGSRFLLLALPIALIVLAALLFQARQDRARLQCSDQRFRGLAETSPTGILIFNATGWLIFANRRWAELTGAVLSSGNGRLWLECVGPAERARLTQAWRHTIATGQRFEAALSYRRADRSEGACQLSFDAEQDRTGKVTHLVVCLTDQTARVRAEAALVERDKLYRLLADHGSDLVLSLSADGVVQFASQAAEPLLGVDPAALIWQPLLGRIHPDDWHAVQDRLNSAYAEPAPVSFRMRSGRHGYRWVEASLNRTDTAGGWVASLRDIAARRAAEQSREEAERRLRESNRLLAMAEGLANVGHWHAAVASGEVTFSPEARAILGLPESQFPFAAALALIDPRDRRCLLRSVARSMKRIGSCECQLRMAAVDGERTFRVVLQADRAPDGRVVATFGVITEVTERLAATSRLRAARDQVHTSAEAKATFLATVDHEIQTLMTSVLKMIELLRGNVTAAQRADLFASLEQSADLLMTALNQTLEFARHRRFDPILRDMQMPRLDGSGGPSAAAPLVGLTADASPHRRPIYAVDEIDAFLPKPIGSAALAEPQARLTCSAEVGNVAEPCSGDELDRRQLGEIREALGPVRTTHLLTLFAQELAARPAAIRNAIGRNDLAAAAAEAHSLKGAALSIGGRTVGQAAAALEQVLATASPVQAERLHTALRGLDRAVASTIAALPDELVEAPCAA